MDLLGGYGSGSDSEPDSPAPGAGTRGTATLLAASPAASNPQIDGGQLLDRLPAPSGSKVPLFSGLPAAAKKRQPVVVQFRVPISFDREDVKVDPDEVPACKRQKAAPRGMSLSQLLPAPKNAGGGRRLEAGGLGGGGGTLGGGAAGKAKGRKYDSDDDADFVPGTQDRTGMVNLTPGDAPVGGNEAFRVDAAPAGAAAATAAAAGAAPSVAAAQQYDAAAQEQYAHWAAYYQQHQGHEYNQHQQAAAAAAAASAADPAEAMLAAALAAERERAARRGQRDAVGGIEIKEVRGEDIKHMAPGQRAEALALRNAFGADYEARLRQEAGSDPNKLAKRRHQIGSLYHYAKQKELEQLEMRAAGSKTKAETQRKYGW
ncbi:proline-rich PRCC [Micractinium conductrix]|uniref:Proline-rich PRCC n=1 Tax=Micractinium conductrix TaxID=554055 RepID=A0A2P6V077_9CHLO|nr:proline-rich PRCC [Micractinium conductrix]|eukprot:PSC67444.1 proline-rich PRCC [Micractinium conductrix]